MTATLDAADPFAPFLATLAERHYAAMRCPTCDDRKKVWPAGGDWTTCPDCDKPRKPDHGPALVFSDWLQDEFPAEPWAHAWSEFVRLGVELVTDQDRKQCRCAACTDPAGKQCVCLVIQRSRDLLARHGAEWARPVLGCVFPMVHATKDYGHSGGCWDSLGGRIQWSWGVALPETFKFPTLDAWTGQRCFCRNGQIFKGGSGNPIVQPEDMAICDQCSGTGWRVPPVGPALARRVPLRRVEFADKRTESHEWTERDTTTWSWWRDVFVPSVTDLPRDVFNLLEGDLPELRSDIRRAYPTEAAANAALSDAAIRWAIKQGVS